MEQSSIDPGLSESFSRLSDSCSEPSENLRVWSENYLEVSDTF